MAPYAHQEHGDDGQVSNAVESRHQCAGRGAVANSDGGLEKEREFEYGGPVVTDARGDLVQLRSDECTGFLQTSEFGEARGSTRFSRTDRAKTSHPDEFVGGCEPAFSATEVARKRMKNVEAEHASAKRR